MLWACPLLRVISAHPLGGVGEGAFLCGVLHVLPVSPRVGNLTKTCSNPGHNTASPWIKKVSSFGKVNTGMAPMACADGFTDGRAEWSGLA